MMQSILGNETVTIRPMTKEDYTIIRQWMVEEKWNPGKFDGDIYFSGKEGKYYYVLEVNGKITAGILIYNYSTTFSFLGAYITEKSQREKGYGKALWNYAIKQIEDTRQDSVIGLYAVPAQVNTYLKSSFFKNSGTHRWQGCPSKTEPQNDQSVAVATSEYLNQLAEYDATIFHADRKSFLNTILNLPMSHFIFSHEQGKITGFAIMRPCEEGYRIGPLYAENFDIAKKLFHELLSFCSDNQSICFDGNARNKHADTLGEFFKFKPITNANCIAMYKGNPPKQTDFIKEYAVMSLELG